METEFNPRVSVYMPNAWAKYCDSWFIVSGTGVLIEI